MGHDHGPPVQRSPPDRRSAGEGHIYPIAIDAVASGKVNVKGIVTNIYDLDDVQRAMDESVHNKADIVKGVIKIHP